MGKTLVYLTIVSGEFSQLLGAELGHGVGTQHLRCIYGNMLAMRH